jgi:hypothetical protein
MEKTMEKGGGDEGTGKKFFVGEGSVVNYEPISQV